MSKQAKTLIALIVAGTIVAEVPWVEKEIMLPLVNQHPHLAVLAEGIVGVLMVWWAGKKQGFTPGARP